MGIAVKYGTDSDLEELANQLLGKRNKRSTARDVEKMSYESGLTSPEELRHYDPANDWDTQDSAFAICAEPSDLSLIEPSICDGGDGNVRARSRENPRLPVGVWGRAGEEERRGLSRHVDDDDDWGLAREEHPTLGVNEGPRKTCTRCKRSRGLQYFSPRADGVGGLRSWCEECRNEAKRIAYAHKKARARKKK